MSLKISRPITRRQYIVDYVSPLICDELASGSAEIDLNILPFDDLPVVTGLLVFFDGTGFVLSWGAYNTAICYNIYRALAPTGPFQLISSCHRDLFFNDNPGAGVFYYYVTAVTPDGETPPSEIVGTAGGGGGCPPESGDPCPTGLLAFDVTDRVDMSEHWFDPTFTTVADNNPILWDEFTPDYQGDWLGTGRLFYELPGDYPPGFYQVRYIRGFSYDGPSCGGATPDHSVVHGEGIQTDEWNRVVTIGLFVVDDRVTNYSLQNPPAFPPAPTPGSGSTFCSNGPADAQAQVTNFFHGTVDEEKRWETGQRHSNDGGAFRSIWNPGVATWAPIAAPYDYTLQILQVGGLIQQARKLQISDYEGLKGGLPLPVRSVWDGSFDERTEYTETTCVYNSPASGGFGGAQVFYTQTHPTAPNGAGWTMRIFNGAVLTWEGHKNVGETAVGVYYRAAGFGGPPCFTVANKEIWELPALPPDPTP